MVTIKKKTVDGRIYYYIGHAMRDGSRVEKKEKYLGKTIPADIDEIKRRFLFEIYKENWYPKFEAIKKNYSAEQKKVPDVVMEKEKSAFAVKFTYDTQRIEGSRLTLRETADLLERGTTPKSKPMDDAKEAQAHRNVFFEMLAYKKDLSMQIVLYWHKRLFEGTKGEIAGRLRDHQVAISGSRFMPPLAVEVYPLMRDFFGWYGKNVGQNKDNNDIKGDGKSRNKDSKSDKTDKIHPVELAALVHLKMVTIHPFADGNGRIARLVMNFILNRNGYPMLNIPYQNRNSYYNSLERAQTKGEERIFVNWFFKRYLKENAVHLGGEGTH